MTKMDERKIVVVESGRHISKLYTQIHREYRATGSVKKPSVEQREWMTLISFLNKNKTRRCKTIDLKYPFTIRKQEQPDFLLADGRRHMSIEVSRITPKNLEAMFSLCYIEGFDGFDPDPRLFSNDIKMSKDELKTLLWRQGQEFSGSETYGYYMQRRWAELVYATILSKSRKKYSMDILLLDDHHIQTKYRKNVVKGLEYFQKILSEKQIGIVNIKSIISETQGGLIIVYDKGEWRLEYRQSSEPHICIQALH